MLSLWSAINPGVWVGRGPAEGGTWTIPANATIDANTRMLNTLFLTPCYSPHVLALTPFWNSQSGYWASSGTTTTGVLGYTYPEFNGLDMNNPSAVRNAIIQYVANQYGPGGGGFSSSGARPAISMLAQPPATGGAQAPVAQATSLAGEAASPVTSGADPVHHPFHSRGGPPHTTGGQHGDEGSRVVHDWSCRIHCKKYELGGSYWVLIFLGEVPDDPSQWRSSPSFVGGHYVFANSSAEQCANCREQGDVISEGFVHLNKAIAARSGLPSYEPSIVSPYLRENLNWRVQGVRLFPLCLCLRSDAYTCYFLTGQPHCGRFIEAPFAGGYGLVHHFDVQTWWWLPGSWTATLPSPHHPWSPGRCSPRTGLKNWKNETSRENGLLLPVSEVLYDSTT
jgi:tyrosinase